MTTTLPTFFLALILLLGSPGEAVAQRPATSVAGWAGLFLDPGTVVDDESGTRWDFGTGLATGARIQRLFGGSLVVGLDVGYAPLEHEVRAGDGAAPLAEGRAHLVTTMVTGRLGAGGGGEFGTYLTGGLGALTYGIPHLERWDSDFAFRAGGGLEYRHSPALALFLEWNRWWALHQTEGVDDNTVRHSTAVLGVNYGF